MNKIEVEGSRLRETELRSVGKAKGNRNIVHGEIAKGAIGKLYFCCWDGGALLLVPAARTEPFRAGVNIAVVD